MKLTMVYSIECDQHITWGIATNKKSLKKIKREAVKTCIDDHYSYYKRDKIPYSVLKEILLSIKIMQITADQMTSGVCVALN